MGCEIERKFLLRNGDWRRDAGPGVRFRQGYFERCGRVTCRVRLAGERGFLTIKGERSGRYARSEFEYEIPVADAEAMLAEFCGDRVVEKIRYRVPCDGRVWEVDEYLGPNAGLFTAELELDSESERFALPPWLGAEVSDDWRYSNGALAVRPYETWKEQM